MRLIGILVYLGIAGIALALLIFGYGSKAKGKFI